MLGPTQIIQIGNYIYAFFTVVVMNCAHPVNWQNCSQPLDECLYPEIASGLQMRNDPTLLYRNERDAK